MRMVSKRSRHVEQDKTGRKRKQVTAKEKSRFVTKLRLIEIRPRASVVRKSSPPVGFEAGEEPPSPPPNHPDRRSAAIFRWWGSWHGRSWSAVGVAPCVERPGRMAGASWPSHRIEAAAWSIGRPKVGYCTGTLSGSAVSGPALHQTPHDPGGPALNAGRSSLAFHPLARSARIIPNGRHRLVHHPTFHDCHTPRCGLHCQRIMQTSGRRLPSLCSCRHRGRRILHGRVVQERPRPQRERLRARGWRVSQSEGRQVAGSDHVAVDLTAAIGWVDTGRDNRSVVQQQVVARLDRLGHGAIGMLPRGRRDGGNANMQT